MTYEINDIIDTRFKVVETCSDRGGMGTILHVIDITNEITIPIVLKYCKLLDEPSIKRFKREVRMLHDFIDNSKVVQLLFSNTEYEPPYFIMKYYENGDLSSLIPFLRDNFELQENIINQMIDCVAELHNKKIYHRDIKPQNFLIEGHNILISDFGLGKEEDSLTRFTTTKMGYGTEGYFPPEYIDGDFKTSDSTGDIFMIGKSIYQLLTNNNPLYLNEESVNPAIFHVIEKSCSINKKNRYQTLAEMKQAVKLAYDVLLSRSGLVGEIYLLSEQIMSLLVTDNKYNSVNVIEYLKKLSVISNEDQHKLCKNINKKFFSLFVNDTIIPYLSSFLNTYNKMVETKDYAWDFAEDIANNMKIIFSSTNISYKERAFALDIAIRASDYMNRFTAMDTCNSMITSITDTELANHVAVVLQKNKDSFITNNEPTNCKCLLIRNTLLILKNKENTSSSFPNTSSSPSNDSGWE